ncbi:MAG: queuosine precursor transporter [Hymenobacteraceae bacterium]|nr:queuosine precursor transporter [Hymenobacteraceae bacterium]
MNDKKSRLLLVLSGIFLVNALLAEVIGVKIFSLESWLGTRGAGLQVFGSDPLDFNLTAGVIIWPVVFVTTDIINEYFGPSGVRRVSWLTAGLILYAFLVITLVTHLPPAGFWLELNNKDAAGNPLNINLAFSAIFRQGLGIIAGSLTAFLIGQLIDASVFSWLRRRTGERYIWLRATGSTLVSQLIDSFVVLWIAFHLFGNWPLALVVQVATINYLYKVVAALMLTPVLYVSHGVIDRYLGPAAADALEARARADDAPTPAA